MNHTVRTKGGGLKPVRLTRAKAIRLFCLECVCWVPSEIEKCTDENCPLYPYRTFGTRKKKVAVT